MYKTRINNEVKEYESLLEAKMDALLSFKKTNKLVEVLNEKDEVVFSKKLEEEITIETKTPVEEIEKKLDNLDTTKYLQMSLDSLKMRKASKDKKELEEDLEEVVLEEPTEEQVENALDSVIRNELSKLFSTIDDYNADLVTLQTENADEEHIKVLEQIIDDLNVHVGLLQSLLQ